MVENPRDTYEEAIESVRNMIDPDYWAQFRHYARTGQMNGRLISYLMTDEKAQEAKEILDKTAMEQLELITMDSPKQKH